MMLVWSSGIENTVSWCSLETFEDAAFRLVRSFLGLFTSPVVEWLS